jgi:hypothetical protein
MHVQLSSGKPQQKQNTSRRSTILSQYTMLTQSSVNNTNILTTTGESCEFKKDLLLYGGDFNNKWDCVLHVAEHERCGTWTYNTVDSDYTTHITKDGDHRVNLSGFIVRIETMNFIPLQ